MNHVMSPTGVAVLIMLALVIDWMSFGPDSLRDKIAFLIAIVSFRQGFNGSPLDNWTVGAITELINTLKSMAGSAYIAGAVTQVVLSAAVGVLAVYAVGCLMPAKFSKKLGKFAELAFPTSTPKRINTKLWVIAALLGMLAELPGGIVGRLLTTGIDALTQLVSPLPALLFGA
jgi:hypothetical protein